jgi:hypothetical protein
MTKNLLFKLLHALKGMLSHWIWLHLQSALTNLLRASVFGYGLSLCVIDKEGLCPSNMDINRLMMMIK